MKSIKITGDFSIEEIQSTKRKPLMLKKGTLVLFHNYNKEKDEAFVKQIEWHEVESGYKELPLDFKGAMPRNYFILSIDLKARPNGHYNRCFIVSKKELSRNCVPYRAKKSSYLPTGIKRKDLTLDLIRKPIKDYKPATNGFAVELFLERAFKGEGFSMDEFLSLCKQRGRPVKTKTKNGKPHGGFARVFEAAKAVQHWLGDRGKVLMAQDNKGMYQLIVPDFSKFSPPPTTNRYKVLNTKSKEEQLVLYEDA